MSTSQALMAPFNTDMRSMGVDAKSQLPLSTGDGEAFAGLLAAQLPDELESVIDEMSPEQLARLEQAALAVDGNKLPAELQDWLQQLPDEAAPAAEDALAVIGQWMQLLPQDAARSGAATGEDAVDPALAGLLRSASGREQSMLTGDGESADTLEGEFLNRGTKGREQGAEAGRSNLASAVQQSNQAAGQSGNQLTSQSAQAVQQDFSAALQRAAGEPSPTAAALFGKLVEQMDTARSGRGEESDALDGINRAATQSTASAAALTARPVVGAAPPESVPFGHQSWGESMVERVMWMSSQNLSRVEIRLDPAELGPLEIQIQNRGQELQVQFVSQNPSVREALEGQMHRLREMFAGQGLDQAEVTVADRSAGEQSRQGEGQRADRSAAGGVAGHGQGETADGEVIEELLNDPSTRPLRGLIDYYA